MSDVRALKPATAIRLINANPHGLRISERTLRIHMNVAGLNIGDGVTVDLVRYAYWLATERRRRRKSEPAAPPAAPASAPPPPSTPPAGAAPNGDGRSDYERHRDRMARREAAKSRSGRDIGPIPPVADPKRREEAERSLLAFANTYFRAALDKDWSPDHLRVIARMEDAIRHGGLFAIATPRGFGKTTICEIAALWAILLGLRRFVALVGASDEAAGEMLDSIKSSLENNELLQSDFPEVCHPILKLERIAQRANGQLCDGLPTDMEWGKEVIVLPTVRDSKASGAILKTAGLTGRVRGMSYMRTDGVKVRPDLVIPDDPQTDESARSPTQCTKRERLISGAVLGLAGPGQTISGFMPCTVIMPGDMADRILNRDIHPEWQGERMKMVYAWPERQDLWDRYAELRRASLKNGGKGEDATEFYAANRDAMDKGAQVQWPARFAPPLELSAIQHAWNLRIDRGDHAFFAEYQNEPLPEVEEAAGLEPETVCAKAIRLKRGVVPAEATTLTAYIDVQGKLLYWLVAAWSEDFSGHVVDYGTWPEQKVPHFTLRQAKRTLQSVLSKAKVDDNAAIRNGLERLAEQLIDREWRTESGASMRIARCLIDVAWGNSDETIREFCRRHPHAEQLTPSRGKFVGANKLQFADYRMRRGDRVGLRWRLPLPATRHQVRILQVDTNYWKSFVAQRLAMPIGQTGSITLYQGSAEHHRMLAEHCCAERREEQASAERTVDIWTLKKPGLDNHWFDCLVGATVAASVEGVQVPGTEFHVGRKRRKWTAEDLRRRAS